MDTFQIPGPIDSDASSKLATSGMGALKQRGTDAWNGLARHGNQRTNSLGDAVQSLHEDLKFGANRGTRALARFRYVYIAFAVLVSLAAIGGAAYTSHVLQQKDGDDITRTYRQYSTFVGAVETITRMVTFGFLLTLARAILTLFRGKAARYER